MPSRHRGDIKKISTASPEHSHQPLSATQCHGGYVDNNNNYDDDGGGGCGGDGGNDSNLLEPC